jgi:excisionase family DNA binding protein
MGDETKRREKRPRPPRGPGEPYTAEEAAAALRISVETIYVACRKGEVEALRIGGRRGVWRIEERAFEAYKARMLGRASSAGEARTALRFIR